MAPHRSTLLPKSWATDSARRAKVRVPTEVTFQTKPELVLALLDQARAWGVPFATVVTDAGYGDNPTFLLGLDDRQVAYVAGVSSTFGVRLPDEVRTAALVPLPCPRGRDQPTKPRPAPLYQAKDVRDALPAERWQTITWRESEGTVLRKQFVAVRVHWATGGAQFSTSPHWGAAGPEGWLLGERPVPGERGEVKWYYSNLPEDTPLQRLVELAHSCWPIDQFYEDAKGECGLDYYQGRRWDGLHRHLALVMLAYGFLARQRWTPADSAGVFPQENACRSRRSIVKCWYGSSKMWCYGSSRPIKLFTSAPGGTNKVVLELFQINSATGDTSFGASCERHFW